MLENHDRVCTCFYIYIYIYIYTCVLYIYNYSIYKFVIFIVNSDNLCHIGILSTYWHIYPGGMFTVRIVVSKYYSRQNETIIFSWKRKSPNLGLQLLSHHFCSCGKRKCFAAISWNFLWQWLPTGSVWFKRPSVPQSDFQQVIISHLVFSTSIERSEHDERCWRIYIYILCVCKCKRTSSSVAQRVCVCVQAQENVQQRSMTCVCARKCKRTSSSVAWRVCVCKCKRTSSSVAWCVCVCACASAIQHYCPTSLRKSKGTPSSVAWRVCVCVCVCLCLCLCANAIQSYCPTPPHPIRANAQHHVNVWKMSVFWNGKKFCQHIYDCCSISPGRFQYMTDA